MNALRVATFVPGLRAALTSLPALNPRSVSSNYSTASIRLSTLPANLSITANPGAAKRLRRFSVAATAEGVSVSTPTEEAAAPAAGDVKDTPAPLPDNIVEGLDIRVGLVIKAWKHPEADSLYVEEVDIGEESGPRTICSGLVKYVPEDELQGRPVLVLANLKPRNMRGVKSNGMLLAASDAAHENVELLIPPEGAAVGERVWFGGDSGATQAAALAPNQLQKKKVWEAVQPLLKTSEEGVAVFREQPMRCSSGLVTSKTLKNGNIS